MRETKPFELFDLFLSAMAPYLQLILYTLQTSDMISSLADNKIIDFSDVFGALPIGTATTTPSSLI